jgi:hypothetical protein
MSNSPGSKMTGRSQDGDSSPKRVSSSEDVYTDVDVALVQTPKVSTTTTLGGYMYKMIAPSLPTFKMPSMMK